MTELGASGDLLDRARLQAISDEAQAAFAAKNGAREAALSRCREVTRHSANAIRAVHRGDYGQAESLIARARLLLQEARSALQGHDDILYAGFVHDAEKEYAEAETTLSIISGRRAFPGPQDLGVTLAAYLNGLGETVGELRRHLLDRLRLGEVERCEECLAVMDDIFGVLMVFDYPDAMTGGLRRTADSVRGILERTRGDLSLAARQRDLERSLASFQASLERASGR